MDPEPAGEDRHVHRAAMVVTDTRPTVEHQRVIRQAERPGRAARPPARPGRARCVASHRSGAVKASIPNSEERIPKNEFRRTYSVFRIPHSVFRTPHPALRTPHSALRSPRSALRTPNSALYLTDAYGPPIVSALPSPHSECRAPLSALRIPHSALRSHWALQVLFLIMRRPPRGALNRWA